ncbi:MAG: hypothetical protein ISN28_12710 [Ectothiorhodospiraceae bacterium AqS1]|nr:hypothetical protein [Ectothiorhodospiraceae bacterium AqS1]
MSQQEYEPKFKVENLGAIREGEFTQKPLTIFCGPNNSGKTWVMYSLYYWSRMLSDPDFRHAQYHRMDHDHPIKPSNFKDIVNDGLPGVFNMKKTMLGDARVDLVGSIKSLKALLDEKRRIRNVFLMPVERSILHPFFRELGNHSTAELHHATKKMYNINELLGDTKRSNYPQPIADYIDWLNKMPEIMRESSKDFHKYAETLKKRILRGSFSIDKRIDSITFKPHQIKRERSRACSGYGFISNIRRSKVIC